MALIKIVLFQITALIGVYVESASKPNIILLIADDLGWNDVGFHGSNEIPTPNIDALAYSGIILNRHYTMPTCTPSRSALMTGKYPIRLGMQGPPIAEGSPISLPLNEKILPQYLKDLGYISRLVGKWHLGYYKTQCMPTHRGFDSHFGYYNGWTRYNDSVIMAKANNLSLIGLDAWSDHQHAGDRFKNNYNTDVFTDEAVNIIKTHDAEKPLFLDLSYAAVHAIPNSVLQVRDIAENNKKFAHIKDENRRLFAGVLSTIDESIPRIMQALHDKMMLSNSIILFISDNGGATEDSRGLFANHASNWPLRGMKSSVAEGGVRGVAAVWSPLIKNPNHVTDKLIHLTDWLPTFYAAAGGNTSDLGNIDGINQWPYLTDITTKPPRNEILVNIDEVKGDQAIIHGNWKLIKVIKSSIKYAGSTGREEEYRYNMSNVMTSHTRRIISSYVNKTKDALKKTFWQMRNRAKIDKYCERRINELDNNGNEMKCFEKGCLFNIKKDPCEYKDLSEEHRNHYHKLESELEKYRKQLVKQQENTFDPKSNPKYFDDYWSPWVSS